VIKRGDIYFVDLSPVKGREQRGRRPVLVVSSDAINCQPLVIVVVVGTDGVNISRDYPVSVRLSPEETGLPEETVFLCFQLRAFDHERFIDSVNGISAPAGSVSQERMQEVNEAIRMALSL